MNTRLQQFLAAENISQGQFADSIDVARASVSHILAGRNKPGYDFISNLIVHYPNLNIEWLLTGRGKMYRNQGAEVRRPDDDNLFRDDALFADPEPVQASIPKDIPVQIPVVTPKIESSTSIITEVKNAEVTINQRKAVKVVIFYDDGTFQELMQ
ncbi:MAG: helix-turn-helix transcriptional regulator [Bacteroidales bacterium]|nr:helix-turn-helix transcriptional regulator [Bacteroidales bacterium]